MSIFRKAEYPDLLMRFRDKPTITLIHHNRDIRLYPVRSDIRTAPNEMYSSYPVKYLIITIWISGNIKVLIISGIQISLMKCIV